MRACGDDLSNCCWNEKVLKQRRVQGFNPLPKKPRRIYWKFRAACLDQECRVQPPSNATYAKLRPISRWTH
jgi:hypothetical protein